MLVYQIYIIMYYFRTVSLFSNHCNAILSLISGSKIVSFQTNMKAAHIKGNEKNWSYTVTKFYNNLILTDFYTTEVVSLLTKCNNLS